MRIIDKMLRHIYTEGANLENGTAGDDMKKIRRRIDICGETRWISADTEQEYADILVRMVRETTKKEKHIFRDYAMNWFEVYAKPNIAAVTAETYFRQLEKYILPEFGEMTIEDISADHIQQLFNRMDVSKASKEKTRMVLNMIFCRRTPWQASG